MIGNWRGIHPTDFRPRYERPAESGPPVESDTPYGALIAAWHDAAERGERVTSVLAINGTTVFIGAAPLHQDLPQRILRMQIAEDDRTWHLAAASGNLHFPPRSERQEYIAPHLGFDGELLVLHRYAFDPVTLSLVSDEYSWKAVPNMWRCGVRACTLDQAPLRSLFSPGDVVELTVDPASLEEAAVHSFHLPRAIPDHEIFQLPNRRVVFLNHSTRTVDLVLDGVLATNTHSADVLMIDTPRGKTVVAADRRTTPSVLYHRSVPAYWLPEAITPDGTFIIGRDNHSYFRPRDLVASSSEPNRLASIRRGLDPSRGLIPTRWHCPLIIESHIEK